MAEVKSAISYTTKAILAGKLELAQLLPVPFEVDMMSTLNYHYGVYPDLRPENLPKVRYFGVGIGGRYTSDDEALTSAFKALPTDLHLFKPLPFRMVPQDEDITDAERTQYRIRAPWQHPTTNIMYWCYYLKLITYTEGIRLARINPATHLEEPYEIDPSNLTPVGKKPSTGGTIDALVQDIKAYCTAQIHVQGKEIIEAINVLHKGDLRFAVISEIGLYSGEDKLVNGLSYNGGNISYQEAIYTQLVSKKTINGYDMSSPGDELIRNVVFTNATSSIVVD
jgi:hypothetical protein